MNKDKRAETIIEMTQEALDSGKEDEYANWWLRDVVSSDFFAGVSDTGACPYKPVRPTRPLASTSLLGYLL